MSTFEYISTNKRPITVGQMIEILSKEDRKSELYILDDNNRQRPIIDIGKKDNNILICDF